MLKEVIGRMGILAALATLPSGCAALLVGGAAGAGTYAYVRGELRETLPASPEVARRAIERAIGRFELRALDRQADNLTGRFKLKTGDSRDVLIQYERVTDHTTDIRIRVGIVGDQDLSAEIMKAIRNQI